MTTFNTVEELFQILDSDPQLLEAIRARILTPGLLRLPESQASLVEEVRTLGARVDDLTARVDALTARMDDLAARLDAFIAEMRAFVAATNQNFDRMQTQLDKMRGDYLESRLPSVMLPLLSRECDVRRTYIINSAHGGAAWYRLEEFFDKIADAADEQVITDDEEVRVLATDMIIGAQRKSDRSTQWFTIEASGVINRDDIDRVRTSADAIMKVYEQDAIPVTYGYQVHQAVRQYARESGVRVFIASE